jgi:hypothetical protein
MTHEVHFVLLSRLRAAGGASDAENLDQVFAQLDEVVAEVTAKFKDDFVPAHRARVGRRRGGDARRSARVVASRSGRFSMGAVAVRAGLWAGAARAAGPVERAEASGARARTFSCGAPSTWLNGAPAVERCARPTTRLAAPHQARQRGRRWPAPAASAVRDGAGEAFPSAEHRVRAPAVLHPGRRLHGSGDHGSMDWRASTWVRWCCTFARRSRPASSLRCPPTASAPGATMRPSAGPDEERRVRLTKKGLRTEALALQKLRRLP